MAGLTKYAEKSFPLLVSVPVTLVAWKLPPHIPDRYHADVVGSSLTMAAIFLGFMATSLSILISMKETQVASALRGSDAMKGLVGYLRQAIFCTLLWLISSFLLYFLQPPLLITAWVGLGAWALMCFLRVVFLLSKLIL
jgi:hypothetical protein